MKKKFVILLCFISIIFLTGCSIFKKSISTDEFIHIAEGKGLYTADVKQQFSANDEIISATIAASLDGWQIEYYTLTSKDDAKRMYNKNKSIFESDSVGGSKSATIDFLNYTKYTLENSTFYMVASRIDNTFLYAKVPIAYKSSAIDLINALGY